MQIYRSCPSSINTATHHNTPQYWVALGGHRRQHWIQDIDGFRWMEFKAIKKSQGRHDPLMRCEVKSPNGTRSASVPKPYAAVSRKLPEVQLPTRAAPHRCIPELGTWPHSIKSLDLVELKLVTSNSTNSTPAKGTAKSKAANKQQERKFALIKPRCYDHLMTDMVKLPRWSRRKYFESSMWCHPQLLKPECRCKPLRWS